jgi:hypothetical protein
MVREGKGKWLWGVSPAWLPLAIVLATLLLSELRGALHLTGIEFLRGPAWMPFFMPVLWVACLATLWAMSMPRRSHLLHAANLLIWLPHMWVGVFPTSWWLDESLWLGIACGVSKVVALWLCARFWHHAAQFILEKRAPANESPSRLLQ